MGVQQKQMHFALYFHLDKNIHHQRLLHCLELLTCPCLLAIRPEKVLNVTNAVCVKFQNFWIFGNTLHDKITGIFLFPHNCKHFEKFLLLFGNIAVKITKKEAFDWFPHNLLVFCNKLWLVVIYIIFVLHFFSLKIHLPKKKM